MDDREQCVYIHCPITFVLNRIEEKFFFASFDRMGCTHTHVIDPTIFLVRKEAIFDTFEWFTMDELQNGDNYETTIDRSLRFRQKELTGDNQREQTSIGLNWHDESRLLMMLMIGGTSSLFVVNMQLNHVLLM